MVTRSFASLALIAMAFAVLADRERHPVGDRAVLTAVVAGAAMLSTRDRRLVAAAVAFAVATWATDAGPPGWASGWVRGLASLRVPPPDGRPPADFVERAGRMAAAARFEEECRLYGFAALNLAAFLTLMAASPLLRRRGR
ncbi:MAG: hypothetical protein BGO49_31080 [Planctomycetales bacterium 71-10]|nr:MAG: hypothetical protein BGO49_31080 [Planctomycetales bacterium 71-10]